MAAVVNLQAQSAPERFGKVWLVGAGPGDPELLTLKAVRALGAADLILIDDLANPAVLDFAPAHAVVRHVGKRGGCRSTAQGEIHGMMARAALNGRNVVRLKGGDPMIFGRGHEEVRYLRALGIETEVVNGLTAGMAAATSAGIPLTDRSCCHGVTFVTAHTQEEGAPDWAALIGGGTTLVIYMGMGCIATVGDGLLRAGMAGTMPAAIVASASLPQERIAYCSLATLVATARREKFSSPAIIIVGRVAALADRIGQTPLEPDVRAAVGTFTGRAVGISGSADRHGVR